MKGEGEGQGTRGGGDEVLHEKMKKMAAMSELHETKMLRGEKARRFRIHWARSVWNQLIFSVLCGGSA